MGSYFSVREDEAAEEDGEDEAVEAVERVSAFVSRIRALLSALTQREADVVSKRLGLDGQKPRTQKQVSKDYDVSRAMIHLIEKGAIRKMERAAGLDAVERNIRSSHSGYATYSS